MSERLPKPAPYEDEYEDEESWFKSNLLLVRTQGGWATFAVFDGSKWWCDLPSNEDDFTQCTLKTPTHYRYIDLPEVA